MFVEVVDKLKEAIKSILPMVIIIVLINYIFLLPQGYSLEVDRSAFGPIMLSLIISSIPLIIGTALFSLGAEKSVAKIGEVVGTVLTKRKSIKMLLIVSGLMGFLATVAEPDLSVLSSRISPEGPDWLLIIVAGIGVGIFMLLGILRIAFNKRLKYWFCLGYGLVFTIGLLSEPSFFSIIFDAGGMTTGVVTVPFILSLGMGVARVASKDDADNDSFGFSGLCSMGTVLLVVIYSVLLKKIGGVELIQNNLETKFNLNYGSDSIMNEIKEYSQLGVLFGTNFLHSFRNVTISMSPILLFFVIFNFFVKIKGRQLYSIIIGFVFTLVGLVLFFLGAECGFMPIATSLGKYFGGAGKDNLFLFLLVGFITGFISMLAEPAVNVLSQNVSEVSSGAISKKTIILSLCFAESIGVFLNILRMRFDIPFINFIVPLFIAASFLSLFSTEIYVGIAIDAAGVATGTMASCFFLPLSIGYVATFYQDKFGNHFTYGESIMANGFGIVGIMSVMPIITIETLGIIARIREQIIRNKILHSLLTTEDDNQIIHLPSPVMEVNNNGN